MLNIIFITNCVSISYARVKNIIINNKIKYIIYNIILIIIIIHNFLYIL